MTDLDFATLLRNHVADLAPIGNRRWKFPIEPGTKRRAGVQIGSHWATFRCPLTGALDEPPFASIVRQSGWRGGAKLVLARARVALRAEVPLLTETAADRDWLACQVGEVVRGLQTATGHAGHGEAQECDSGSDTDPEMLAELCRAAGWSAVAKADGEVRVDVESRSVRRVVRIARHGQGLRASVLLGSGELGQASKDSQQAAAGFLLRASSSLRFARAWASGSAAEPAEAGFECLFRPAGNAPLVTAIAALATACDLFGREAEALIQSTAVARQYLNFFEPVHVGIAERVAYRKAAIASEPSVVSEAALS